ncbi:MAG TPA: methyltransferase domain-containing protein [Catenuloplanes sp.]|jgi:ubiquinone/menaquinone biosynthesis C-methylase UbiE
MGTVRGRGLRVLAGQLGHPRGVLGRLVGRLLNRRNARNIAAAVEALDPVPGANLADLGFGGGIGLRLLLDRATPGGRVHGVDRSATMLAAAARRFEPELSSGRLHLQQGSLERLPLPDGVLDGAITLNTIYFLAELDPAFAEFRRILKPTARMVVGLADPVAMAGMPVTSHGFRLRPVEEVVADLARAGLRVIEDRRVGEGAQAYHLLVASPQAPR